jgi:branched-chain amino acid aminotransferase
VGGRLVSPHDPSIRPDDRALVGHGVFEALKMVDGVPFAKRRHLERLVTSGEGAGVRVDLAEVEAGIEAVAASPVVRRKRCWLRVTVTGGPAPMGGATDLERPTVVVATAPLPEWDATSDVVVVPWRRNERGALCGLKTTSYLENGIALRYARSQGADEGIFANTVGNLCEGTGTNIFVVDDGEIVTPPLAAGPLNGVTRQLLLEWMPGIVERDLPVDVLDRCEEAFITSTSRDVHPVRSVDGRPLDDVGGDLTSSAMACFAAGSATDSDP